MIHDGKRILSWASTVIWGMAVFSAIGSPSAAATPQHCFPRTSVRIRVCGFFGLSPTLLAFAEAEAARVLRGLEMQWIECRCAETSCGPEEPDELTVRIVQKALPGATRGALGMASWSGDLGGALVFYDRALTFRSRTRMLHLILGRAMAHEIVHLLSPEEPHSDGGLMRGLWTLHDLGYQDGFKGNGVCRLGAKPG